MRIRQEFFGSAPRQDLGQPCARMRPHADQIGTQTLCVMPERCNWMAFVVLPLVASLRVEILSLKSASSRTFSRIVISPAALGLMVSALFGSLAPTHETTFD